MIASLTKSTVKRFGVAVGFLLFSLMSPEPARGQDIYQTVARISYVSGPVSYSRGDDPDEWDPAVVNVPFTLGDRIYSPGNGRAELQFPGGNFVRLGRRTYFTALNLTHDVRQFYLGEGVVAFNIRRLGPDEIFEIDTPNMAVTLEAGGRYRIEVDEDGNSRVLVRSGRVVVAAKGRQITVEHGEIRVYGIDSPRYEIIALRGPDAFDRWVDDRDARFSRAYPGAYRHVNDQVIGVEDLSDYGRWEEIPEYGYAWTPTRVPFGWQPFTAGHWFWQDPWGWTWISEEPWGWAPSHYGRWTFYRTRWYWVPVERRVVEVRYLPAVVGFVRAREHVGWFPLHPRDRLVPWWGRRAAPQNVTFVNQRNVVVVNQNTFVSARNVTTNVVRDTIIVKEARSVRVMEQPLPVPSRSSLRVAAGRKAHSPERPPANVLSRPAVVRTAPAPPPPTFQEKLPEIQRAQGEPVAPEKALTISSKNVKMHARRNPIRPAAVEASRADFAPRTPSTSTSSPQTLTAAKGKKLATPEEPVLTSLPQRPKPPEKSPPQLEQARSAPPKPTTETAKAPEPQQGQQPKERLRTDQQRAEQRRRELERRQRQEGERRKQESQMEAQKRKEQQQFQSQQQHKEQERQALERQQKQQEQKHQKEESQPQAQKRKEQQQLQKQQHIEQERRQLARRKQQEQKSQKEERQLQAQQLKEQRQQELQYHKQQQQLRKEQQRGAKKPGVEQQQKEEETQYEIK